MARWTTTPDQAGKQPAATTPSLEPLFMWAGGKRRLLPVYEPLLPAPCPTYVEPFLGGGAVFALVATLWPRTPAILGDVNPELVRLFESVRDDPETLAREVAIHEACWMPLGVAARKELYYRLRKEYWAMPPGLAATALLYFLMKTGFNGIWQTCRDSQGRYGTPVGLATQKTSVFDPACINAWSLALQNSLLHAGDYAHIDVPEGAFVFCDPPYRGSYTSYGVPFGDAEQERLIAWCRHLAKERGCHVWLCNRDVGDGFFEREAPDATRRSFPIVYTAGRRKKTPDGFLAKPAQELLLTWAPPS